MDLWDPSSLRLTRLWNPVSFIDIMLFLTHMSRVNYLHCAGARLSLTLSRIIGLADVVPLPSLRS